MGVAPSLGGLPGLQEPPTRAAMGLEPLWGRAVVLPRWAQGPMSGQLSFRKPLPFVAVEAALVTVT